MKENVIAFVNT